MTASLSLRPAKSQIYKVSPQWRYFGCKRNAMLQVKPDESFSAGLCLHLCHDETAGYQFEKIHENPGGFRGDAVIL